MFIRKIIFYITLFIGFFIPFVIFADTIVSPGYIDPAHSTSWLCTGEPSNGDCHNHTLINWMPSITATSSPVTITDLGMSGWIWSENFGWIRLAPDVATTTGWNGVTNTAFGVLSGYAWGIAGSWINFRPTTGGVTIQPDDGKFSGYAFAQNFGWMYFDCSNPSSSSCLQTTWRHITSSSLGDVCTLSSFTASSTAISYGSSTTLYWSTNSYCNGFVLTRFDSSSTSTASYGTSTLSIDTGTLFATTTYSLLASGSSSTTSGPLTLTIGVAVPPIPDDPTATPAAGTYTSVQTVALSSIGSTSIHYTTDGTAPTCSTGTTYSSDISVSSSLSIKAVGCNTWGSSSVSTFDYTINFPPTDPVATPPSGTYTSVQTVSLSSSGATSIHYTIDGTTPSCSTGTTYSGSSPIDVSSALTILAIACGSGGSSGVSTFSYTINTTVIPTCTDPSATNFGSTSSCVYGTGIGTGTTTATTTVATTTSIIDVISTATSVQVVVENVKKSITETKDTFTKAVSTPTGSTVVTTVAATGAAVSTSVSVATGIFLSPLSFADILLIPLRLWSLLMGLLGLGKKKKPWGTVFDSITKQPLDPAYVLLRNMEGQDVATAITDLDGRYGFVVPKPGNYFLVANKTNYLFPSQKLVGNQHDELYEDLYFGEHFAVSEKDQIIAKNIPMDPLKFDWNEFAKRSQHLMKFYSRKQKWIAIFSNFFFYVGLIVSSVSVLLSMTRINIIMFALYATLYCARHIVFKAKPFGTIVSSFTKQPIPFAIVRVIQQATGVEVMHRVADIIGHYYCLLPNGDYFIRIDQKQDDSTYKTIAEKIPVKVTDGYLSEKFSL